jgi:L-lysine 6-transaminase
VQTGVGLTGSAWAYQQLGLEPDLVAFAKKTQVGGVMAGRRLDDVADNVFQVSGRINSTWGGGLVDMVRSRRLLEIIEAEHLIATAAETGEWLGEQLQCVQDRHPGLVSNARGRGLMCAIDLPDPEVRDQVVHAMRERERVLILPCGERSMRFRPSLCVRQEELQLGLDALERCLAPLARRKAS